ncbi:MAG: hypothetical protein ABSG77_17780 [Candidatus Acidiferrum sp.]
MSNLISGVKNFESHTASLLWGLPFIQLQSAKAKGSLGGCFAGLAAGDSLGACAADTAGPALVVVGAGSGFAGTAAGADVADPPGDGDARSVALRPFSSALSCSISACMAANCFATAGDISGSGAAADRAFAGAVLFVVLVSLGNGSCRAATFG